METPLKNTRKAHYENLVSKLSPITVPASPMLKQLGYGTGVNVYRLERSPRQGTVRSPWAVKQLNLKCRAAQHKNLFESRLVKEAETLRKLNHPNIVGFRKCDRVDGKFVLLMEDCHQSLGDIIEERYENDLGPLPAHNILKVCSDVLSALAYLHEEKKLLHGDLKSHNVLIKGKYEICKLCDFGVSLPIGEDGTINMKNGVEYVGTELWTAPEVLDECDVICEKADIFSFGLVIYEMIALLPPHMANEDSMGTGVPSTLPGTRPILPGVHDLGSEYNIILEMFYLCTNDLPEDRPRASICLKFCKKIEQ